MLQIKHFCFILFFLTVLYSVSAATYWVNDPTNLPNLDETNFPGQDCTPQVICGDNSDIAQCIASASIVAPAGNDTSNTNWDSGLDGGYVINGFATADASSPYCDNSGSYWCDRNETCYSGFRRNTNCVGTTAGGDFGVSECDTQACRSGYLNCDTGGFDCEIQIGGSCGGGTGTYASVCNTTESGGVGNCTSASNSDCNNDDGDGNERTCFGSAGSPDYCEITSGASCGFGTGTLESGQCTNSTNGNCTNGGRLDCNDDDDDGNVDTGNGATDGLEILIGGDCSVGTVTGVYSSVCSGSVGTCVVSKSFFETGTFIEYLTNASQKAMLWFKNHAPTGWLINATNSINESWGVDNNSCMVLKDGTVVCDSADIGGGSGDNSSWNETYANTLYLNRSSELLYTTTFNSSYDSKVTDNSSWNESYSNTLLDNTTIIRVGNESWIVTSVGNWSADKPDYYNSSISNETYVKADGTTPLTNNWDVGSFDISARWFNGSFNFTTISDYISFDGSTFILNDSLLNTNFNQTQNITDNNNSISANLTNLQQQIDLNNDSITTNLTSVQNQIDSNNDSITINLTSLWDNASGQQVQIGSLNFSKQDNISDDSCGAGEAFTAYDDGSFTCTAVGGGDDLNNSDYVNFTRVSTTYFWGNDKTSFFPDTCTYGVQVIDENGGFTCRTNVNDAVYSEGTIQSVCTDCIGDSQLLYNTGQHLTSTSVVDFNTLNTGQGDNNLYDMNQNVLTTSSPTFVDLNSIRYVYGDYGTIARSTDEWLRLNDGNTHTSGVYTGGRMRVDGELQQGDTDYGAYELQATGQAYISDYLVAPGGLTTSTDPGAGNILASGDITATNDLFVNDFARLDSARVGTTSTDPGDGILYVEDSIYVDTIVSTSTTFVIQLP